MADEQPLTRRVEVLEEKMANLESFQENFDKTMGRVNDWILEGIEKGAASPIITLG